MERMVIETIRHSQNLKESRSIIFKFEPQVQGYRVRHGFRLRESKMIIFQSLLRRVIFWQLEQ